MSLEDLSMPPQWKRFEWQLENTNIRRSGGWDVKDDAAEKNHA